jgi:hypothetical protein
MTDYAPIMEEVARYLLGEPNARLSHPPRELRFGSHGSLAVDVENGTYYDFETEQGGGVLALIRYKEELASDKDAYRWLVERGFIVDEQPAQKSKIVATYDYVDESGVLLFQVVRFKPKDFRQRRPGLKNGKKWAWNLDNTPRPLSPARAP